MNEGTADDAAGCSTAVCVCVCVTLLCFLCVCCLPHLLFGLLEALRHKVNLLEGGDKTLLVTGRLRVEHLHTGLI